MKSIAFHTLGCKLNFAETSAIGRQFIEQGFEKKDFSEAADIYVINTCSVTEQANRKCRNIIRQAMKKNPDGFVIVTGCYAQLKPQEIAEIPGVDLVVGAGDKFRILELIEDFRKSGNPCVYNNDIKSVNDFVDAYSIGDRTRTFLKIQDGCDYKCSFCTIPLARGKSRSDSLTHILENARTIAKAGIQEIILTGVNIGDYGKDQPETLGDVIQALDEVEGIQRFRISSIEPNLLNDSIIHFVGQSRRFMPHFHLPLQSGDNEMLAHMRRRYRRELYADRVATIKSIMPHACIGVDVIVGFPGETDKHFEHTYRFLNELDISYLHVFTYSERENTPAAYMDGKTPLKVRHQRNQRLRNLSEMKRRYFYQQYTGSERTVLFEQEQKDGTMYGFTDNYIKVAIPFDPSLSNQLRQVYLEKVNGEGMMEGQCMKESFKISS